jgi:flavodoxin
MIIYASKTGHTKKIAHAMAEQLGVTPKNISEKPVIENIDLLFIGSGIYGGKASPDLIQFIDTLNNTNIKNVVLFSTCTSGKDNMKDLNDMLVSKGIHVIDKSFVCKGQFLLFSQKHPDDMDMQNAKRFAADVKAGYNINID